MLAARRAGPSPSAHSGSRPRRRARRARHSRRSAAAAPRRTGRWRSRKWRTSSSIVARAAIDRAHDHLELGALQRLQDALLDVEHHLRVGIVVDQADQEIAPQRQRARLRIGHIAELADHLLDPLARLVVEQGRAVDDPADRLLGDAREARDIVDRRLAPSLPGLRACSNSSLHKAEQPRDARIASVHCDTGHPMLKSSAARC